MIEKTVFGHLPSGEQVDLYTITNSRGASVSLQTLGCRDRAPVYAGQERQFGRCGAGL